MIARVKHRFGGEKGRRASLSTAALEGALQHAGKIDRLAKGIGHGNIWEEFLRLGLRLTAAK